MTATDSEYYLAQQINDFSRLLTARRKVKNQVATARFNFICFRMKTTIILSQTTTVLKVGSRANSRIYGQLSKSELTTIKKSGTPQRKSRLKLT